MALPSSGSISMSQVNVEIGRSSTATIALNESAVRSLFGVASGAISLSQGYGKANAWAATITSNQTNLNLRTWALANGWNGSSAATVTVNSGVYIYSTNTGNAGLTINGSWAGGITLINNGNIIGMGGNGGYADCWGGKGPGADGGPAISLGVNVTITNNSYISGGGGGGGGTSSDYAYDLFGAGGGGAGGGTGGVGCDGYTGANAAGGAGGAPGGTGGNGVSSWCGVGSGGGGGRILPGTGGGSLQGGGAGGGGGGSNCWYSASNGASGGSGNNPGGNARPSSAAGGGGGGWGASGGTSWSYQSGGAGGKAVALNGYSVTWTATGTRWGAIS